MSTVSAHVLDAVEGKPAIGVSVELRSPAGAVIDDAVTDADGRIPSIGPEGLEPGTYVLAFDTATYFASRSRETFYPEVLIVFTIDSGHYHVPLLLSPFAYSTYRGS